MPCDTIREVQVDAGKFQQDHLLTALNNLGLHPKVQKDGKIAFGNNEIYDPATGVITQRSGRGTDVSEIKQSYAAAIVESQAKKFGWHIKKTSKTTYEVVKR